jgi:hypothetical protein
MKSNQVEATYVMMFQQITKNNFNFLSSSYLCAKSNTCCFLNIALKLKGFSRYVKLNLIGQINIGVQLRQVNHIKSWKPSFGKIWMDLEF